MLQLHRYLFYLLSQYCRCACVAFRILCRTVFWRILFILINKRLECLWQGIPRFNWLIKLTMKNFFHFLFHDLLWFTFILLTYIKCWLQRLLCVQILQFYLKWKIFVINGFLTIKSFKNLVTWWAFLRILRHRLRGFIWGQRLITLT